MSNAEAHAWAHTGDMTKSEGERLFSPSGGGTTLRFWLKEGTSRQAVFIDGHDDGFRVKEHNLTINGTFGNAFTCIQNLPEAKGQRCPLCAFAERRKGHKDAGNVYGAAYFTVADLTPYTNREGKVFPISLMLLVCKKEMLSKFSTMRKEMFGGALTGRRFLAMRSAAMPGQSETRTPRIGDNWQHMDQVPLMQIPATQTRPAIIVPNIVDPRTGQLALPFDYFALLAPKTYEDLAQLVAEIERGGGGGGGGGTLMAEQPVPYGVVPAAASPALGGQPVPYGAPPAPAAAPVPYAVPVPAGSPAPFAARPAVAPAPVAVPTGQPVPYGVPVAQPVPVAAQPAPQGDPGV